MIPTGQSSTASQESLTEEILKVLEGFGTNVEQLVKGLESNNQSSVDMVLSVMTQSDYGSQLFLPVARLSDPGCLVRLVNPLKAIEANLIRASTFTGKSASPSLQMFVPSKLELVRSILADVQKRSGSKVDVQKPGGGTSPKGGRNRSRTFVIFGGLVALLGLCWTALLIFYVFTPEGAANIRANGFGGVIVLFVCCSVPVLALGGGLIFLGVKRQRSPKGSEPAKSAGPTMSTRRDVQPQEASVQGPGEMAAGKPGEGAALEEVSAVSPMSATPEQRPGERAAERPVEVAAFGTVAIEDWGLAMGTVRALFALLVKGVALRSVHHATNGVAPSNLVDITQAVEGAAFEAADFHILASMGLAIGTNPRQNKLDLGQAFDARQGAAYDAAADATTRWLMKKAGDDPIRFLAGLTELFARSDADHQNYVAVLDGMWEAGRQAVVEATSRAGDERAWNAAHESIPGALEAAVTAADDSAKRMTN